MERHSWCGLGFLLFCPLSWDLSRVSFSDGALVCRHGCCVVLGLFLVFSFAGRFVGLVVKASASRAEDPGLESRLRRDFLGVESYQ